jgi:3,4-dihydroxy 2-butanone 4-phosphate synthase/GTP cyclohydrolase II
MEQPDGGLRLVPGEDGGDSQLAPAKMDFRDYGIGAQILSELGLRKIRLLSGTQRRVVALDGYDLEIVEQIPL